MNTIQKPTKALPTRFRPLQLMVNPKDLESKTVIVYLFSKPKASKLFISDKPANLKDLIKNAHRKTALAG